MGSAEDLKAKIAKLEKQIAEILENTRQDLELATTLQKLLMPNRTHNVSGVNCITRYYSAGQLNSDTYDLITSPSGRHLWFVHLWTASFGLSSLFLHAIVQLQTQAQSKMEPKPSLEDFFDVIALSLAESPRNIPFRIRLSSLDTGTLKLRSLSQGFPPLLKRSARGASVTEWNAIGLEGYAEETAFADASSKGGLNSSQAVLTETTLEPGCRIFSISPTWNREARDWKSFMAPLQIGVGDSGSRPDTDLKDDTNHLLYRAEAYTKAQPITQDVSVIALEIDRNKLHLA
ncbi:MAG TPA: hypothetical protein VM901_00925 [Bdellovibrionota bacterium]|nr:hypothetical protein [Bdellovibrionota bacterium]